jgi:hypothetical protein
MSGPFPKYHQTKSLFTIRAATGSGYSSCPTSSRSTKSYCGAFGLSGAIRRDWLARRVSKAPPLSRIEDRKTTTKKPACGQLRTTVRTMLLHALPNVLGLRQRANSRSVAHREWVGSPTEKTQLAKQAEVF